MADESISVALTDDGTIEQVSGLLEVFGVTAEAAASRAQGAFVNVSKSQDAAAASAKLLAAAQAAGVTALDTLELSVSKLTTSELLAATSGERLATIAQALAVAQTEGVTAAVALASALSAEAGAMGELGGAADSVRARFGGIVSATEALTSATAGMNVSQRETVALLTQFGLTAAEATERVAAGSATAATSAQGLATTTAALAQAAKAGYLDIEALANAIGALSQDELVAISNGRGMAAIFETLTAAVTASNSAFAANEAAVSAETGTFTAAANASEALAVAIARLGEFMAADAATAADLAASMRGVATAETEAAGASEAAAVGFANVQAAGARIASTFGGLNAIFAGAFATHEIIEASDEFQKITGTLTAVTGSAKAAASAYGQIRQVANETQTPLEANVNTYGQLAAATSHAGLTSQQLIDALKGIDAGLKVAGTSGQPATAALRSLAEVFETTGSATRYFQNLQRESPFLFQAIKKAADDLGISLTEFGSKSGDVSKRQQDLSAILGRVGVNLQSQIGSVNTVAGALTVLKNNLVDYVGSSTTASTETALLRDVIYGVATNLNIAIPAVLGLAAAVVTVKIAQLATDLVRLTSATIGWVASLNPTVLIVAGLTIALVALVAIVQKAYNAFTGSHIDVFGATLDIVKEKAGQLGTALGSVGTEMQKAAQSTGTAVTATDKLGDAATHAATSNTALINTLSGTVGAANTVVTSSGRAATAHHNTANAANDNTRAHVSLAASANTVSIAHTGMANTLNGTTLAAGNTYTAISALGTAHTKAAGATQAHTSALEAFGTATIVSSDGTTSLYKTISVLKQNTEDSTHATVDANAALKAYGDAAESASKATDNDASKASASVSAWQSLTSAIRGALQALLDYAAKAAGLGSLGGTGGPAVPSGAARNGGTFAVPGGSGVDSKLIAVSPGEVVTVQTPAQYRAGERPYARPAQTHFATGGITTGAGVDLGTGVTLTGLDTGGSVTGFSDGRSDAIGTLSEATTANTDATAANTAALSSAASSASAATAANAVTGASTTLTSGTTTFDGTASTTLPSLYNPVTGASSPGGSAYAGVSSYNPGQIADASGNNAAGVSIGNDNAAQIIKAVQAQDHASKLNVQQAVGGKVYDNQPHFRDGGDLYIPGGSGVDSRTIQMAVSPGESVHVRTPAQQNAGESTGSGNTVVHMTVHAKDAGSFKASSGQLKTSIVRGLRRTGRSV